MHTPAHFKNDDSNEVKDFIRQNSFGILVSNNDGKLLATHIPLELSADGTKLTGHIARANPQWKNFDSSREVLSIFNGPHTYISSSWYVKENVPTWNYIAAHVYGSLRIVEGDELYEALKKLVDRYEVNSARPVDLDKMDINHIKREMHGIVGFEISVNRIESAFKLSQNRDAQSYQNILQALDDRTDEGSARIAEAMRKIKE